MKALYEQSYFYMHSAWLNIVQIVSIDNLYGIKRKQEKTLVQELAPKTSAK